jgi:hypothetical protein
MTPRLFCYGRHYDAVMHVLYQAGLLHDRFHIVRIDHRYPLNGLEGATFVYVENHPSPVPREMLDAAQAFGLIEMKLNDEAACARGRAAYERADFPRARAAR